MRVFCLRVVGDDIAGGALGAAAAHGRARWPIPELAALLGARPGVALRGRDAALVAREEEAGRLLAAALRGPVSDALERFLGGPEPRVVLVEGSELPWELLADSTGRGLEATGQAVVARLVPGALPSPMPARGSLDVGLWCADEDETSRTHADALRQSGARDAPSALLHIVCHGARDLDALLGLADAGLAPGTLSHDLAGRIRAAALVALDVCLAGSGEGDLARAVLSVGCGACIGPRTSMSTAALGAFDAGLHAALTAGHTLAASAAEGRRRVRRLASPRPDARWYRLALFVTHPDALTRQLVDPAWRPRGWPEPDPRARAILEAARSAAAHGYVGIEHLARAVSPAELPPELRGTALPELPPLEGTAPGALVTERLASWSLAPGFGEADLVAKLAPALRAWLGVATQAHPLRFGRTLDRDELHADERPLARALEVIGGPEDGRLLQLAPGATLGRWAPDGPDVHLYAGTPCWDPWLSRRHLRWDGPGAVTWLRPGEVRRLGVRTHSDALRQGDVLWLTRATTLVAR